MQDKVILNFWNLPEKFACGGLTKNPSLSNAFGIYFLSLGICSNTETTFAEKQADSDLVVIPYKVMNPQSITLYGIIT